ncbi:hypothetical protein [Ornithinimicrobium kibberense]|uniref:hypothetical protein n=1 Tax=Ornithinimicrobium kibberense TaxID=282060 RepID=UPI003621EF97
MVACVRPSRVQGGGIPREGRPRRWGLPGGDGLPGDAHVPRGPVEAGTGQRNAHPSSSVNVVGGWVKGRFQGRVGTCPDLRFFQRPHPGRGVVGPWWGRNRERCSGSFSWCSHEKRSSR